MEISFADRVEVPKHVLVRFLSQETVLLNMEAEFYYGLDEIATRMWQVVITSPNIDTACVQLISEFEVEPESLRRDFLELLGHLVEKGLLRIQSADTQSKPAI